MQEKMKILIKLWEKWKQEKINSTQRVKIETPIGSIESDSGNHLLDIGTVIIVIIVFLITKKILTKYIK